MTSTSLSIPKGRVSVFFCGGAGVNIAQAVIAATKRYDQQGVGEIEITMIDSSSSNLPRNVDLKNVYLLKDMDGAGKDRAKVHAAVSKAALDILEKHTPGDLSIVVGSLAGGSGSVAAPILLKSLLDQGKMAIAIGITSQDSTKEITNTINTLKSYEKIAELTGRPVVLYTQVNGDSDEHEKINTAIASAILMLATLASRQNTGLDSADLNNWTDYRRVSSAPVKMVTLELVSSNTLELPDAAMPITTATLAHKGSKTRPAWDSDYQCVGYVPEAAESNITLETPLHLVICDGMVAGLYKQLNDQNEAISRRLRARVYASALVGATDTATDDGLIL